MSFRTRIFLGIVIAVLVPLGALAFGVRHEMERRLTGEYENRVSSMAAVIEADLAKESAAIANRLSDLALDLARSNRFRLSVLQGDRSSRRYLLDYAGDRMSLSGLSMLQIQDSAGRILSSGHFRNQFDQLQPELPRLLTAVGTMALVRTRTPEAPLLALARVDSFKVGGTRFNVVGGKSAEPRLLDRSTQERDLSVDLVYPGVEQPAASGRRVIRELWVPYVDLLHGTAAAADTARFVVTQSLGTLEGLQWSVDRWFVLAGAFTIAVALALAGWLSSRISRPLRQLAGKTAEIDLDRLDQSFESDRQDEIGALSRLLGAMTDRLRSSAARLREAERRAAVGELARQVNHDIKNGLAPIRNVLRHLGQVVKQDPASLPTVFESRQGTLESSVEYLDNLARNYDRLAPNLDRGPCDINTIVEQVLRHSSSDGTELRAQLAERLPSALGGSLLVRRILENLVGNALDSIAGRPGATVTVSTEPAGPANQPSGVRIIVADTGPGMSRSELDRAFDDFYTTKSGGTGLGLSIVRRLILDLNGTLRVETEPGAGTRATIELPTAPSGTP